MKKKIVVLLSLVLVMCTLLCACGGNNSKSKIVGTWKDIKSSATLTFNEDGTCAQEDGVEYKYEIDEDKITIFSFGNYNIKTNEETTTIHSEDDNQIYAKETEYDEVRKEYIDKASKEFYENKTEIKVGETYTLNDGTVINVSNIRVKFNHEMFEWFLLIDFGVQTVGSNSEFEIPNGLYSTDMLRFSTLYENNLYNYSDNEYCLSFYGFSNKDLEEDMCVCSFEMNGTSFYFDLKSVEAIK